MMIMLRCGLRVQEVANLTLDAIDYQRSQIVVRHGKGGKDRIVYISDDAATALAEYLRSRLITNEQRIFLVEIGQYKGNPVSVRAIQKRVEHYAKKSAVHVTAHRLRHTMATQLLNANADLVSIQQILGHSKRSGSLCLNNIFCFLSGFSAVSYTAISIIGSISI
jgi:site-specific recombinase XerD